MAESSSRIPIVVAIITAAASIGVALIANWDKLFAQAPAPSPVSPAPAAAPVPVTAAESPNPAAVRTAGEEKPEPHPTTSEAPRPPALTGTWHDVVNPGFVSSITQDGSQLRFTRAGVLPNGVGVESAGAGMLSGNHVALQYLARYSNGQVSQGGCEGALSGASGGIELYCSDSLLGSFRSVNVRQ